MIEIVRKYLEALDAHEEERNHRHQSQHALRQTREALDAAEAELREASCSVGDEMTFDQQCTEAVNLVRNHPGVEHIWLNAFACVSPSDEFAADVGRTVISKVMAHRADDVLDRRHIVLRINAS